MVGWIGARTRRQRRRSAGLRPRLGTRPAAPSRLTQSAPDRGGTSVAHHLSLRLDRQPPKHVAAVNEPFTRLVTINIHKLYYKSSLFHLHSERPAPNLTCDCLLELSVRVLCFIDNITCTISRAQKTLVRLCCGCGVELWEQV